MAIDSAEKRKSVAGIGLPAYGPGVTPNASKDGEWRQQSGYSYSGIATSSVVTTAASLAWRFSPPDFARTRKPNVAVGTFTLQPINPESVNGGVTLDKWIGSHPDRAWGHAPRPRGGMTAPEPIRPQPDVVPTLDMWDRLTPDLVWTRQPLVRTGSYTLEPIRPQPDVVPTVEMWEFKPPDFAKGHAPRPHGGMSAPDPISPESVSNGLTVDKWMFHPPDFAGRRMPRAVDTGIFTTDPVTPPPPAPECSWLPVYPDFARSNPFAFSRAWYHPAYQAPFTVSDFVHSSHMLAGWFMVPSITSRFGTQPAITAAFETEVLAEGTQGMNP